jgi:hypothetical protein
MRRIVVIVWVWAVVLLLTAEAQAQDPLEAALRVRAKVADTDGRALAQVLADPAQFRAQVLVRRLGSDGAPVETWRFRADAEYFFPASAVKLAGAVTAVAALRRVPKATLDTPLEFDALPGLDPARTSDPSVPEGRLTLRDQLQKALVVSDNEAFNRCFELTGHREMNALLWQMGLKSARMHHRLSNPRPTAAGRKTPRVRAPSLGPAAFWPARESDLVLPAHPGSPLLFGTAHNDPVTERRIEAPMDFGEKNALSLDDHQRLLGWVVLPGGGGFGVTAPPGFTEADRGFVRETLGQNAPDLRGRAFEGTQHTEARYRPTLPGVLRVRPRAQLEVRGKAGKAYGFHVENAFYRDVETGRGFLLAVAIFANTDGVMNDGRYDYATITERFLRVVGEVVARRVFDGD